MGENGKSCSMKVVIILLIVNTLLLAGIFFKLYYPLGKAMYCPLQPTGGKLMCPFSMKGGQLQTVPGQAQ